MSNLEQKIQHFFTSSAFGVIGASTNRDKYGNKVLRAYLQHDKKVYPVNPRADLIENIACVKEVKDLPADVKSISVITPPKITEQVVSDAISHGIKNIWLQPGAESATAITLCEKNNINVIANGPCVLVVLGFHE